MGQFTVSDMLGFYRVLQIGESTRRFALLGENVSGSPSPAMHGAAFLEQQMDARYFPIDLAALEQWPPLLEALAFEGFAVTAPYKVEVASRCRLADDVARSAGAVNTVMSGSSWSRCRVDQGSNSSMKRRAIKSRQSSFPRLEEARKGQAKMAQ